MIDELLSGSNTVIGSIVLSSFAIFSVVTRLSKVDLTAIAQREVQKSISLLYSELETPDTLFQHFLIPDVNASARSSGAILVRPGLDRHRFYCKSLG